MITNIKRKYASLIADKIFFFILSGSVWALSARVLAAGLVLLINIIVARRYGAEMIGVLAMMNSFILFSNLFTLMGTNTSILRLIPEHMYKYSVTSAYLVFKKTRYFIFFGSLMIGTALFYLSDIISEKIFSKPHLSYIFALAAGFVVFKSLLEYNTQALRGLQLNRAFAAMQVLPSAIMLIILLASPLIYISQNIPVFAQLGSWLIASIIGGTLLANSFSKKMSSDDYVFPTTLKEILSISMPMLLAGSMQLIIAQTGVIILAILKTEAELGYYAVAIKLGTLTSFFLHAINSMAAPKFAELYHVGKIEELFYVARKSTRLIFWTTTPILLVLLAFGRPLLWFFFGNQFVVAYPAMVFLLLGQFINSISGSTGYFMNMTGNQKIFQNVMCLAGVINISLSISLIPILGAMGAAISVTVSYIFWNFFVLLFLKNHYGKTIFYFPLLKF